MKDETLSNAFRLCKILKCAPAHIFDVTFFVENDYVIDTLKLETLLINRFQFAEKSDESIKDAILKNYGDEAVQLIIYFLTR